MAGMRHGEGSAARLGRIFVAYAVAFAGFAAILWLMSTVGVPDAVVYLLALGAVMAVIAGAGIGCRTMRLDAVHLAGRDIPALHAGMAGGADWMTVAAFLAVAGVLPFAAEDGGVLALGWTGGLVLCALLVAPFLQRFGGYGIAEFFAARYGSALARLAGVAVVSCVCFLYAAALLSFVGAAATRLAGIDGGVAILSGLAVILVSALPGGLRGVVLAQAALLAVILAAFVVPAILTLGGEAAVPLAWPTSSGGLLDRFVTIVCLAAGTAAMPHVLARAMATRDAGAARCSAAWTVLAIAVLMLSAPAFSAFSSGESGGETAHVAAALGTAAVLAAALSTAAALLLAMANAIGENVHHALIERDAPSGRQLFVARGVLLLAASAAAFVAAAPPADISTMIAAAFALAATGLFPALILGIWWKRANAPGAVAGILAGLGACIAAYTGVPGLMEAIDGPVATAIGLAAGFVAIIATSLATRAPSPAFVEALHGDDAE